MELLTGIQQAHDPGAMLIPIDSVDTVSLAL